MLSLIGVYVSFLATLPTVLLTPASYDLYDQDLFAPDATDLVDEPLTFDAEPLSLDDLSMFDMPVDSGSLEASSAALDGPTFDSGDSSIFDDSGSIYLSNSCISAPDATISVGKSKVRRGSADVCPNSGTNGNAPTGEQNEPPLRIPSLEDLPSLDNPLVLPVDPPEDEMKCPARFPARLCCEGPTQSLELGYLYTSVANCRPCKHGVLLRLFLWLRALGRFTALRIIA